MEVRKLKNHLYANCHVSLLEDGTIIFTSYNTDVLVVTPTLELLKKHTADEIVLKWDRYETGQFFNYDGVYVSNTGLYSMTTRHQIGYFLDEYLPFTDYYDIKALAERNSSLKDGRQCALYFAGQHIHY